MKALASLSVRTRLQSALAVLALLTCFAGAVAWITLESGQSRLKTLNTGTLTEVDDALRLSSDAADLATRMPFLLALDSPFRVHQEGEHIIALIANIENRSDLQPGIAADLKKMRRAVFDLLAATQSRSALLDRILRLNAEVAHEERRLALRSATVGQSLYEGGEWLTLQRIASTLLGAGRAENLIGLGEFQREFHGLTQRLSPVATGSGREARHRLVAFAQGDNGLFELRRRELAHRIAAANALVRIRIGAEIVSSYAATVTATAQREIASELTSTTTMISVAKSTILIVMLISTAIALFTAQFVARYVTANLSAIADGMMRLAAGDRASSLPRSYGKGDEIGKLLRAFRVFRANAIRLDRAHRQRIRQTALWETMVLGMSDGVAVLAPGGGITATNDRLADVLGVPPSSLAGPVNLDHLLEANGWRSTTTASDYAELTDTDGRTIERRDRSLPDGGAVVLFSDATERRQFQDRMLQIQRIEGLAKISGEVAHDFGNILSTISSSVHMLEAASPERSRELRQSMASAVELGTSLTQRLLAFARRQHLEPELVELNELVEGLTDLIYLTLRDNITLNVQPAAEELFVRVDAGQLESAIINICLNAAQAIPDSGRIAIALAPSDDGHAILTIEDTGLGMAPNTLAHAMEPFFSARADGKGTGLGLAMVYGFIRQSNGDVQIESQQGVGTTVRLILPRSKKTPVLPAPSLPWHRILLVEDNPADAVQASELLSGAGATVTLCTTATMALDSLANEQPFDAVITDLHLGNEPAGWEIAERALARDPATVVFVVSGHLPATSPLGNRYGNRLKLSDKPLRLEKLLS
ncbi:ATP-binding protein [Pleomorphomonas sp. JP5]|uniref:sensor histidine kinase n=1 Tax=Pleomorphomonas sp. JP5 TaxID=2942998 RepID=UPI002042D710|nr:ATP-binding protein [Pleomorphomonas sp. JP5]MCM5560072.1 ATP-binding protein [Pleomorphomonas sp. JP5]